MGLALYSAYATRYANKSDRSPDRVPNVITFSFLVYAYPRGGWTSDSGCQFEWERGSQFDVCAHITEEDAREVEELRRRGRAEARGEEQRGRSEEKNRRRPCVPAMPPALSLPFLALARV
jgi:hypothetical protein